MLEGSESARERNSKDKEYQTIRWTETAYANEGFNNIQLLMCSTTSLVQCILRFLILNVTCSLDALRYSSLPSKPARTPHVLTAFASADGEDIALTLE